MEFVQVIPGSGADIPTSLTMHDPVGQTPFSNGLSFDLQFVGEAFLFLYCFLGLALICDSFLILSLETMCVRWHLREDVAGATFMALGSAAPEIIVNALSTLKATDPSNSQSTNLGVGAIMGSGCIAFTFIPGACALAASIQGSEALRLKRRPLLRDIVTYACALAALCYFFSDAKISLVESLFLLGLYASYLLVVIFAPMIRRYFRKHVLKRHVEKITSFVIEREESLRLQAQGSSAASYDSLARTEGKTEHLLENGTNHHQSTSLRVNGDEIQDENTITEDADNEELDSPLFEDVEGHYRPSIEDIEMIEIAEPTRQTYWGRISWLIQLPLKLCFKLTCPPCERGSAWEMFYPITLIVSFAWVALFSYLISEVVERWGKLSNVPLSLFGFSLVALGAEIPDTIQSVTVARRGYGSMAVSNAIGSQILNICIGLGLPWTISLLSGNTVTISDHRKIYAAGVIQSINVTLVFVLLLGSNLIFRGDKAILSTNKGFILLCAYLLTLVSFVVYVLKIT